MKPTQRFSQVICTHLEEKKKRQNKIDIIDITVGFVIGFANTLCLEV